MIIFIENPKQSTKKILRVISMFNNVVGYKVSPQKPSEFLYTHDEQLETKI